MQGQHQVCETAIVLLRQCQHWLGLGRHSSLLPASLSELPELMIRNEPIISKWRVCFWRGPVAAEPVCDGGFLVCMAIHADHRVLEDVECERADQLVINTTLASKMRLHDLGFDPSGLSDACEYLCEGGQQAM